MHTTTSGQAAEGIAPTTATYRLLAAGAIAGPVMAALWIAQGLVRDGYDFTRHVMSLLSLGDGGWIQIGNFLLTGALTIAGAVGLRRVMVGTRGGAWAPRLAALIGVGLIAAGVFTADPGSGFPAGAPEGTPDLSVHGVLHGLSMVLVIVAFTAVAFVLRGHFARRGDRTWTRVCVAVIPITFAVAAVPHLDTFPARLVLASMLILGFVNASGYRAAR